MSKAAHATTDLWPDSDVVLLVLRDSSECTWPGHDSNLYLALAAPSKLEFRVSSDGSEIEKVPAWF